MEVEIKEGDTVKVLAHRNAYGEETSGWGCRPFKTGDTFVVGKIEEPEESGYPCSIAFPVGEAYLWRVDDLELVASAPVLTKIERIRRYRETLEVGLAQAKRMVEREDVLAEIDAIGSMNDVKAILRQMVGQS